MSGHSKWSQIKHQKAVTDKKKSQLFSKLSKLISLAAKRGMNPQSNLELKSAIDNAKSYNMPNANVEKAIKRISDKSSCLEELVVEAIGPGGIALKIRTITDNHNRTINELRNILTDHGSKMVPPGSIAWIFNQSQSQSDRVSSTESNQITQLFEALDDHEDVEDVISNLKE